MSEVTRLRLRDSRAGAITVEGITADRLALLSERDIATLPAWQGRRQCRLGDLFEVRGGNSAHVRVEGSLDRVGGLGEAMAAGTLVIDGNAGNGVGRSMTGGLIEVSGDVGDDAGAAMSGGRLLVRGAAGNRLGAMLPGASKGMTGGEIVVHHSAGTDAAARIRRGLVVVLGDVGAAAARNMIAGSVVVLGRTADGAAAGNKRGTLVAIGGITIPHGYRYACTYQPPHLLLTMRYLERQYGVTFAEGVRRGRFRRYCGDAGLPGKGEILAWAP